MNYYKAICTLTWKFASEKNNKEALEFIKHQINDLINQTPQGEDFDDLIIQVDIAKMKDRKHLIHIASFEFDDVFPFLSEEPIKKDYVVQGQTYSVKMNSDRYHLFKSNQCCVSCGIKGIKLMLDINPGDLSYPHFNMYAEENGRLVLMTKDHIVPKSKNGKDELNNYVTMCSTCNNLKGDYDLTYEQIRKLKELNNNPNKLPRKQLRSLIHNTRQSFQNNK